jgi:NAD+ synthase
MKNFVVTEENVSMYSSEIGKWIREKVESSNRKGCIVGMSGGIDCSVVARLCQVGGVDVQLLMMPYGNSMKKTGDHDDSMELIDRFGFFHLQFDIKRACDELRISADKELTANINARLRMVFLYHMAQLTGQLVIGTGNLSERFTGYCTKWGDMSCDLNPIGNLTKTEVRILAKYLEVPQKIIDKAPSAGFWEGQTDEGEMGFTYEQLDNFILNGTSGVHEVDEAISEKNRRAQHKLNPIPVFGNSSAILMTRKEHEILHNILKKYSEPFSDEEIEKCKS